MGDGEGLSRGIEFLQRRVPGDPRKTSRASLRGDLDEYPALAGLQLEGGKGE